MSKLFEITDEILAAYDAIVDFDGELSEEMEAKLAAIQAVQAEKLDSFFYCIRKAEMEEAAAKAQMEQWKKKADARRKAIDWLKNAVQTHLVSTGSPKITTPNGNTFAVQKNGGLAPLVIDPTVKPHEVAEQFQKVQVMFDTDAIRKYIAELGKEEQGEFFAKLGEKGVHLRLR